MIEGNKIMNASSLILPLALLSTGAVIAETETLQLKSDPQLVEGKLENGLRYVVRPNAEPKGRVSVRLRVNTGSLNETKENSGISHFIEHMVFNGSKKFKRNELIPEMQKRGLGLGGDANAYTSLEETVYSMDIPKLDDDTIGFAFNVLRDFADGATMEESSIDSERGVIRAELKARDSMNYRSMIEELGYVLDGTKVADFMPIGLEEVIMSIPQKAFLDYYKKHYVASDMQLVIVGDISAEQGKAWAEQFFGDMEKQPQPQPADRGTLTERKRDAKIIVNPEASTMSISLFKVNPYKEKKDSVQKRIDEIPLDLATAMLNQRLSKMTEDANCPFIRANFSKSDMLHVADCAGLSISANPTQWKEALSGAEQEFRRALEFGFYDSELSTIKKMIISQLEAAIKSWPTKNSADLAEDLVSAMGKNEVFTTPEEDLRIVKLALDRLTAEDCHKALKNEWSKGTEQLCITGKEKLSSEEALATLTKSQAQKVEAQAERKLSAFAYDKLGQPGTVLKQDKIDDLDVTQITLSNGIKISLKPTSFEKNTINMLVRIDGGKLTLPAGKNGLAMMAAQVMNAGGLEAHSAEELGKILAEKRVGWSFGIDDEAFTFSGGTTAQDVEMQLKLLMASIEHPGFRPEAEVQFRRAIDPLYHNLSTDPGGVLQLEGLGYLVKGDPRVSFPSQKELSARTTQEAKDWLQPLLKTGQIELSIVGDFKVDELVPILEKTLGSLSKREVKLAESSAVEGSQQQVKPIEMQAPGQEKIFTYPSQVDRTMVAKAWQLPNGEDKKLSRRLSLLKSVLRDRLFMGIRQKLGEAYSPFVMIQQSEVIPNMGMLVIVSPGVKANQEKVSKAIDEIITTLVKEGITQEELDRVSKPDISGVEKRLKENGIWVASLADSQSKPERLVSLREVLADMKSIKAEEINALAKQYLSPKPINVNIVSDLKGETKPELKQTSQSVAPVASKSATVKKKTKEIEVESKSSYKVLISKKTNEDPAWRKVADTLAVKNGGEVIVAPGAIEGATNLLKKEAPRALAVVATPEEVNRETVNFLHRVMRQLDSDPYGDCIWGVVTGFTPADAQRIAEAKEPLQIKRVEGTSNVDASRFEESMCITDWGPFEVMEQKGYQKPQKQPFPQTDKGIVFKFAEYFENAKPQLLVTSSHATQYNLEMPFEKGLIVSFDNKFHILTMPERNEYAKLLRGVLFDGKEAELEALIKTKNYPTIKPDLTPKVWLAAGNCLFGDAKNSKNTMVVTALSGYGCNQVVGYTVPSWRGIGGWGTLDLLMNNHDKSSLAEAWYLNNQFILHDTEKKYPKLLSVNFNAPDIQSASKQDPQFMKEMLATNYGVSQETMGLVHDRDTVAFYGDPAYRAFVDESQVQSPFTAKWENNSLTITGNSDAKGKFAFWLPTRVNAKNITMTVDGKAVEIKDKGVATNDFVLLDELELRRGQSAVITYK